MGMDGEGVICHRNVINESRTYEIKKIFRQLLRQMLKFSQKMATGTCKNDDALYICGRLLVSLSAFVRLYQSTGCFGSKAESILALLNDVPVNSNPLRPAKKITVITDKPCNFAPQKSTNKLNKS
jgi:hypothetical protein